MNEHTDAIVRMMNKTYFEMIAGLEEDKWDFVWQDCKDLVNCTASKPNFI